MSLLFTALALVAQDGLSYEGAPLNQLPPEAYAIYFDRAMSGYFVGIEDDAGPDGALQSIKTEHCVSHITGRLPKADDAAEIRTFEGPERTWVIDWKTVKDVGRDVPNFFAVRDNNDKLIAFLTGQEQDGEAALQADMLSSSNAFNAALMLHMACNPDARKRYEVETRPPEAVK